jgi:2,3-bisphosphoglycerate-dependent phosphoglycerate mutase
LTRVKPYWENNILPELLGNQNVLVVAHGNSLRSMIKIIDKIDDASIVNLNLPTGIPIVYEFNENMEPTSKEFLADSEALQKAQDAVANQGKSA